MEPKKANFGVLGLGVMGRMIALNMERNGFVVAGYDLDNKKVSDFIAISENKNLITCNNLEELIEKLESPRRILMMVPAGKAVEDVISTIKPHLNSGDLLIDGGNTFFLDTDRRSLELDSSAIIYIGAGISGGVQGAL